MQIATNDIKPLPSMVKNLLSPQEEKLVHLLATVAVETTINNNNHDERN
jgi:hypothetical protein